MIRYQYRLDYRTYCRQNLSVPPGFSGLCVKTVIRCPGRHMDGGYQRQIHIYGPAIYRTFVQDRGQPEHDSFIERIVRQCAHKTSRTAPGIVREDFWFTLLFTTDTRGSTRHIQGVATHQGRSAMQVRGRNRLVPDHRALRQIHRMNPSPCTRFVGNKRESGIPVRRKLP